MQGLPSVLKVTRTRKEKKHGQRAQEVNYYICSRTDCEGISQTIRVHWSIENGLHYGLDVLLGEDKSTRRMGNAAQNIHIISKMALFVLQRQQEHGRLSRPKVQQMNADMKPSQLIAVLGF